VVLEKKQKVRELAKGLVFWVRLIHFGDVIDRGVESNLRVIACAFIPVYVRDLFAYDPGLKGHWYITLISILIMVSRWEDVKIYVKTLSSIHNLVKTLRFKD
jgi:hypothetical protein